MTGEVMIISHDFVIGRPASFSDDVGLKIMNAGGKRK
jgi:hypothetical protein